MKFEHVGRKSERIRSILDAGNLVTAAALGERVGISERSVYRYISRLRSAGHPFLSEAGAGYLVLKPAHRVMEDIAHV